MRTYVGRADHRGLSGFVAEDAVPADLLGEIVRGWAAGPATVFRAVLDRDAAEAIRAELARCRPDSACGLLLNRAFELVPLRPGDASPRG
jgi:hypothetical protein